MLRFLFSGVADPRYVFCDMTFGGSILCQKRSLSRGLRLLKFNIGSPSSDLLFDKLHTLRMEISRSHKNSEIADIFMPSLRLGDESHSACLYHMILI